MSIRKNIVSSYAAQIYVTAIGILMVPMYIKYMGAEAYGLVGFFAMLQTWFNLLDMGLTPTIARESARFHGGAMPAMDYRRLARALEGIFFLIALFGGVFLFLLAQPIADHWLNATDLPNEEIVLSLELMAIIIALRWMGGLYRGVITGAEKLVWLSGFNSLIATCRNVFILPILVFISATPYSFFSFQLAVALLEISGLAWMAYRLLPEVPEGKRIDWAWAPLKPVLKFSLSIAFTSSVWVLVTQTDKLVLSKILPLADYGYFTVAVLVASGIMVISGPISNVLMPRLTRLHTEGMHGDFISVYRQATRIVVVTALPAALILIFFAPQVLWAWTGDAELVVQVSPVLRLYAIGNAFLVIGAFAYYLQYAVGNLRLHLIGSILFVIFLIPLLSVTVPKYGMSGGGWAWLVLNALYFIGWTALVHKINCRNLHVKWLLMDIAKPLIGPFCFLFFVFCFLDFENNRWLIVFELVIVYLICLVFGIPAVSNNMNWFFKRFFNR